MKGNRTDIVFMNDAIRSKTVRLVTDTQSSVFLTRDAIAKARDIGLDLVQVSAGDPPVCRIVDGGKYIFDQKKNARENARRQREITVETKEIQLRPAIDTNDLMVKAKRAREFLENGDKVKIVMRFRGRENAHKDLGIKTFEEFLVALGEHRVEKPMASGQKDVQMIVASIRPKSEIVRDKSNKT